MAEALVSTLLEQITTIICEGALEEVRLLKGVKDDLRKLKFNLTSIKALLEDAEQKQISDKTVQLWLDRLQEESLDMEDALDEWRTVLLYRPTDGAENASFLQRKVCLFFRCFSFRRVYRYHGIAHSIKGINERLDEIAKDRVRYQLTDMPSRLPKRKESTSFIDGSSFFGRDEVKKQIIGHLLRGTSKERESCQTISIVGLGGIGKTALAQLIYNDEEVKQHFTSRIWAYVSNVFDESKVATAIIVALEGLDKVAALQMESLPSNALLERICKSIEGKKYLLILDDVWTENDEDFGGLNVTFKRGAAGSRILVTTRKHTVSRVMGSSHTIHLETLGRDLCWSILKKIALRERDQKTCEDLTPVGLRIADKCKGLPLVAKTLGGHLQFKTTRKEWEDVLNSELWGMDVVHKDVFVPLLLSYYDLPSPVKQCFKYCASFTKDNPSFTCHLIAEWKAQGYLGFNDVDDSFWELKGFEYLKCLEARSFLQVEDFHPFYGQYAKYRMHDLVHDFALFLTKGEFLEEVTSKGDKSMKMNSERTCRHLAVILESGLSFPESIFDAEKLRSLYISACKGGVISGGALCNLFTKAPRLRVLTIEYPNSTIPEEIGNLLHLRYLCLYSNLHLKRLPKALCTLHNLEFLHLYRCLNLERLPNEMGNLVNLMVLDTTACSNLACYPKGVSKLTRLTQLLGLIVRVDRNDPEEFSIGDLANLKQLAVLSMKMVGNTINLEESKKVKLQNLQEVKILVNEAIADADEDTILESLNMSSVPRCCFDTDFHLIGRFSTPRNE
ncbi:hypothetical protein SLEP1_g10111 [Rubroshorea leprosula]|uniref:Uncharacterized protein n=1 Tax=Rubroshorea leprosula TaxID=152421 RepID=A0AAV5IFL8_9ROSI|nr:hypothetical protein SLEP1_g10111 [Rubroshorea leprosula]